MNICPCHQIVLTYTNDVLRLRFHPAPKQGHRLRVDTGVRAIRPDTAASPILVEGLATAPLGLVGL